jgi:uncharacterized protein YdaU (DUF1376 family)
MNPDAKTDIWMPLAIGDYLADTSHLSTIEHGAYLLLLMHYWRKGPLPNDLGKIAQIAKLAPDAWSIAQGLLAEFFKLHDDGLYHQKRSDREIEKWQSKRLKAKEKARKAAHARWQDNAPSNAQAMLGSCPLPSPSHKRPTPKASPSSFAIPEWIPQKPWDAWLDVRKRKGVKNTDHALELAVKRLDKLRASGESPSEVLEEAIFRSWTGLFAVKSRTDGAWNQAQAAGRPAAVNGSDEGFAHPSRAIGLDSIRAKAGIQ